MNVGYVFVLYDVKENRVYKVNKILSKYLFHEQNSVFRGNITNSLLVKLKKEIDKIVNINEDKVLFIEMKDDKVFEEDRIGENLPDDNIL